MGKLTKLTVSLGDRSYPIYIGSDLLLDIPKYLSSTDIGKKLMILTNPLLKKLYGQALLNAFESQGGWAVQLLSLPLEEKNKDLRTVEMIYEQLAKNNFDRSSSILALGGGVIGDVAGYAAAAYLRGINFFQVPTTLLAQVDSSVGGKTGVNIPEGKNLVGAFYQPKAVFIDVSTLNTLPVRELRCGLAEVVKYGVIRDKPLFELLEKKAEDLYDSPPAFKEFELKDMIVRCCGIKAAIVSKDEKEKGVRAILNYGHTVGHALEKASKHAYTHGDAVSLGMMAAAYIAEEMRLITKETVNRQREVLKNFGLPVRLPRNISLKTILTYMRRDKKIKDGVVRFVLPVRLGNVKIFAKINNAQITTALKRLSGEKG
jgi:3-dehydroquinate synthase